MFRAWKAFVVVAALAFFVRAEDDEEDEGIPDEEAQEGEEEDPEAELLTTEQVKGMHSKFDANSDGKVSMAEMLEFAIATRKAISKTDIGRVMEETDLDKDGKVSLDELLKADEAPDDSDAEYKKEIAARHALETKKFKVADQDGNGFLDAAELASLYYPETHAGVLELTSKHALDQKDKDGDGMLTLQELWEADDEEGDSVLSEEEKTYFTKLDKDANGKVDLTEYMPWESGHFHTEEAMTSFFELADKDKDGQVSFDEFEAAKDQIPGTEAHYHFMEWLEHHEL